MERLNALELISEITKRPKEAIIPEATLESIGWDSLSTMELVAKADAIESLNLDLDKVYSANTVDDLLIILES